MLAYAFRHEELRVLRPPIVALGETDLFLAKRLAVGSAGVVLVRSSITDMALDDDQRGHVVRVPEGFDRLRQPFGIIGVAAPPYVPAISKEPRRDIVAKRQIRVPFDGHPVAVID